LISSTYFTTGDYEKASALQYKTIPEMEKKLKALRGEEQGRRTAWSMRSWMRSPSPKSLPNDGHPRRRIEKGDREKVLGSEERPLKNG
jgi:hypothetical protein